MWYEILEKTSDSVTFKVDAQRSEPGRFSIPKEVYDYLELKIWQDFRLRIESEDGTLKWEGNLQMNSGGEIYGQGERLPIDSGQRIRVVAKLLLHKEENRDEQMRVGKSRGRKPEVFGVTQCHLINWMGWKGWTFKQAEKALKSQVDDVVSDRTIKQCWKAGPSEASPVAEEVDQKLTQNEKSLLEQKR